MEGRLASGISVSDLGSSVQLLCDLVPFLSLSAPQFPLPGTLVSQICEVLAPFYFLSLRMSLLRLNFSEDLIRRGLPFYSPL